MGLWACDPNIVLGILYILLKHLMYSSERFIYIVLIHQIHLLHDKPFAPFKNAVILTFQPSRSGQASAAAVASCRSSVSTSRALRSDSCSRSWWRSFKTICTAIFWSRNWMPPQKIYKYRKIRKVVKSTPCCNADSQASAADWDSCFCRLSTSLARPWRSWAKSSVLKRFVPKSTLQGHTTQSKSEHPQEKVKVFGHGRDGNVVSFRMD